MVWAYLEVGQKQWDFSRAVDLTPRKHNIDQANRARTEDEGKKVEYFWRHLPRRSQAKLFLYGFVSFEDMLIIDDKGDPEYTDPHVFIDFGPTGPFQYLVGFLVNCNVTLDDEEIRNLKRVKIFPSTFPKPKQGAVHDLARLGLGVQVMKDVEYVRGPKTIYVFEDNLNLLTEGSLIRIPKKDQNSIEKYAEVTHIYETTMGEYAKGQESQFYRSRVQMSAGRELSDMDKVVVCELHEVMLIGNGIVYLGGE